jgi:GR25 family glycosyltransferase involved in LPS biosynthesis
MQIESPNMNIQTYVLNMTHRKDRREEAEKELKRINWCEDLVEFIPAKMTMRNGLIGCGLSHAYALSKFLFESEGDTCMIFEDDFHILNPDNFHEKISEVLTASDEWDVLLLASNQALPVASTKYPGVYRIHNAQTTSSYVVRRAYAPKLIKLFYEAGNRLSALSLAMDKKIINHFYGHDMIWKTLQLEDNFWAFLPSICIQRESFSDIEQRVVSYGV